MLTLCTAGQDLQSLGLGGAGLPAPRDPPRPNCAVFPSRLFQDKQLRIFDPRAKPEAAQVSRVGSRAGLRLQQAWAGKPAPGTQVLPRLCPGPGPGGTWGSPGWWFPLLRLFLGSVLGLGKVQL